MITIYFYIEKKSKNLKECFNEMRMILAKFCVTFFVTIVIKKIK